jgi:phosphohistidine phosphatase SixA
MRRVRAGIADQKATVMWVGKIVTMRIMRRALLALALGSAIFGPAHASEVLWSALRSGEAVALLRHAEAPGVGDPPGFRLDDCSTQRNLSAAGRAQAVAIGDLFRANGIATAGVHSSEWCRCLDTARLLRLGEVIPLEQLNSLFGDRSAEPERTAALLSWLRQHRTDAPTVLVSHQANIRALTGQFPDNGEMIIVRVHSDRPLEFLGRIPTKS